MIWYVLNVILGVLASLFVVLAIIGIIYKPYSVYKNKPEQKNPMEGKKVRFAENENEAQNADGVKGHLETVGNSEKIKGFYVSLIKRFIDIIVSFFGLVLLSPVFLIISLAIIIDDPGNVIFTQKRIGKNKRYFKFHKFRSMKKSTPHDVPTHMMKKPGNSITKVGKFIRKHSLDELPQLWDIFIGNMSIVGPRPALWNQDLLISERDKYRANDVMPGLTGLAQINGRDKLDIVEKARLDGEYVSQMNFLTDVKCFFDSVHVIKSDSSIIEGTRADSHNYFEIRK